MMRSLDLTTAAPPAKRADVELLTSEHREWRRIVLDRAGHGCEDCGRSDCTLYADHIIERQDGGALYDPANGRCRCASCHVIKTHRERAARMAR